MNKQPCHRGLASRQAGYNLVEIMVALVIGATFIGAVLMALSGTGVTGRRQDSQAQLSEEGQVALNIMSRQVRMTGFRRPDSPLASLDADAPMLFGCRFGFADNSVAFAALACSSGTAGNDAIAIQYDARETLAPTEPDPTDCLGATVTGTVGIVDNRFYIATSPAGNPALYCRGNGGGTAQMLIDNVETLQLRYGIAPINTTVPAGPILFDLPAYAGQTTRYVRANELSATCSAAAPAANSWCGVTSVRICITMRSADNSSDTVSTAYTDCDGTSTSINDRRVRRTMATTISLRNQTSVAP